MVTLNDSRSTVLKHVLNLAGDVLSLDKEDWFPSAVNSSVKDDWFITEKLNKDWIECSQSVEDETKLYSSNEYALDICKCYTHYTNPSIRSTVRGILDIRKHIPNFGDGWTFVDYFAGIGLSSIYLAQQLTAAGINANVVYYNSSSNKSQVDLAKRFVKEFGSPSNLSLYTKSNPPKGDCFMFYEVFEHIREPWDFTNDLIKNQNPKCIVHVSRFNLPNVSGHFKNYKIDGHVYSGKLATREFEKKFKSAGYVRTVIPQEFNGTPRVQIRQDIIPTSISCKNMRWDLKLQKKLEQSV